MSQSEYEEFKKKILEVKQKEISNNQEEARAFLVRAGIFTEKGNVTKAYEDMFLFCK